MYIYENKKKGEGITLGSDDMLMNKFYPMTGTPSVRCEDRILISAYRIHLGKELTDDQCLQMAIDRFQEILNEMDSQKNK